MTKKQLWLSVLLPPLLVAALLSAIALPLGLFPFGDQSVAWGDMTQQVIPLLLQMKRILLGEQNLQLFLGGAGGISFWGVFLFFLSSPFSFLVLWIPDAELTVWINLLVALKMMTAAGTAGFFFAKMTPRLSLPQRLCLSVLYAFCGYTMLFYQNLVWLDMMYLFPLLLWSIHRLITRQQIGLFTIFLTAMIFVQFYLSYMVLIFLILYFGLFLFFSADPQERGSTFILLGVGTVLSLLLSAVAWLPAFFQYLSSARGVSLFVSLSSGSFLTDLTTCIPYLLCGVLPLAILPFLAQSGLWQDKELRIPLLMFPVMLVPLFVDPINKMWHTGSYQCFPVRYGYILSLLGLWIAARLLQRESAHAPVRSTRFTRVLVPVLLVLPAVAAACIIRMKQEDLSYYSNNLSGNGAFLLWLALIALPCLIALMLGLLCYRKRKLSVRLFTVLLAGITATECLSGGFIYFGTAAGGDDHYRTAIAVGEALPDTDARIKQQYKYFDVNLLGAIGTNSYDHYTSLTRADYLFGMKRLGYSSYWMEVSGQGGTAFSDRLLNIGYLIRHQKALAHPATTVIDSEAGYDIATYNEYQSMALLFPHTNLEDFAELPEYGRAAAQNMLFQSFTGRRDELMSLWLPTVQQNCRLQQQKGGGYRLYRLDKQSPAYLIYHIPVEQLQSIYFDCFDKNTNHVSEPIYYSFDLAVNNTVVTSSYPRQEENGLVYLGSYEDEMVTVRVTLNQDIYARSFGIYTLNETAAESALDRIPDFPVELDGNQITASGKSEEPAALFFSIPYDSGYTAEVNGEKAEVTQVFDTFCAVQVPAGTFTVTLTYRPLGLRAGIFCSCAALPLAVLVILLLRRGLPRWLSRTGNAVTWIFFGIFELTAVLVYLMPLLVYCLGLFERSR